jgi:NAD(P)-dependent dehydrogenase (short-subunit alcohol dehydrogenase family)
MPDNEEREMIMHKIFEGKTIAVTGGGSGIGAAICDVLARHGAAVAVFDINLTNARSVADRIGGVAFKVDVTDEKQVAAAYASLGALHGSVNCAGFNHISPIVATTLEDWRKMTAVHLDGAFLNIRAAARRMISDAVPGVIVNIASINGFYGHRGMSGYASGKAGVTMLTRIAALELASSGIRVNAVAPGIVETELTRPVMSNEETAERWVSRIPLARLGQPDDIADIVVFLLGEGSRWITGQTILADGGASLRVEPVVTDDALWSAPALAKAAATRL